MKKLLTLLVGILLVSTVSAQPNMEKQLWKDAKKKAKELTAEGWIVDSSMSLENILFNHYKKISTDGTSELVGNVIGNTSVVTVNQGQQWATTSACISYAKESSMSLKGRLVAEVGAGVAGSPSADSFYEGYESSLSKELAGEVKKSFGIYKNKKDGTIDYIGYFVVNEENAHKARMKAMEAAMIESEFARSNAERIAEFVRNGQ